MKNFLIKEHINIRNVFLLLILWISGNLNYFNLLNNWAYKIKEKINKRESRHNAVGFMNNKKILTFLVLFYLYSVVEILRRQAYAELELIRIAKLKEWLILRRGYVRLIVSNSKNKWINISIIHILTKNNLIYLT